MSAMPHWNFCMAVAGVSQFQVTVIIFLGRTASTVHKAKVLVKIPTSRASVHTPVIVKWKESLWSAVGTSLSSFTGLQKHSGAISIFAQVWGTSVTQPQPTEGNLGIFKPGSECMNFCKESTNSKLRTDVPPIQQQIITVLFSTSNQSTVGAM